MKIMIKLLFVLSFSAYLLVGCSTSQTIPKQTEIQTEDTSNTSYEKITPEQAKEILDGDNDYILLDVRTLEEYEEGHIPTAINIPVETVKDEAENKITDKSALILVYCRSGKRSKVASDNLVDLGYTNVKDFGGINDWKYEIE